MVMLGLHPIIIVVLDNIYRLFGGVRYIEALVILLMFIPINMFVRKYIPVLYGVYRR